jgi:hypothetical protein
VWTYPCRESNPDHPQPDGLRRLGSWSKRHVFQSSNRFFLRWWTTGTNVMDPKFVSLRSEVTGWLHTCTHFALTTLISYNIGLNWMWRGDLNSSSWGHEPAVWLLWTWQWTCGTIKGGVFLHYTASTERRPRMVGMTPTKFSLLLGPRLHLFCLLLLTVTSSPKHLSIHDNLTTLSVSWDRLCGLLVRVPGCRSRGPGATRFSEK